MFRKNFLLIILLPVLLLFFNPTPAFSALTEEGIYKITVEFDRYSIKGKDVSVEQFISSLIKDVQCDGSGAKKVVYVMVSLPAYNEDGLRIPGRTLNAKWKVTMPAPLTIEQSQNDNMLPAKMYGNTTDCSSY